MIAMDLLDYTSCRLCPRNCGCDRRITTGFCGCRAGLRAARAALHHWEEPCISGTRGSGTVFFSGCTLQCCFCQNFPISAEHYGKDLSPRRLGEIFLGLQDQGAHNINLVTPTQYLPWILPALDQVRDRLAIPVVYNCGGYEKPETIELLKDYIDIWLPDLKYFDSGISARYSRAADYFSVASKAIVQMVNQTGKPVQNASGLLEKGVVIRHMVLPGQRKDSFRLLRWLKETLEPGTYLLSLLSQFTPFYKNRAPSASGHNHPRPLPHHRYMHRIPRHKYNRHSFHSLSSFSFSFLCSSVLRFFTKRFRTQYPRPESFFSSITFICSLQ